MFCRECGFENAPGAKFCRECGTELAKSATRKLFVLDNRYIIESVIKSGGMGAVYKAEDTRLGGTVAIKKMLVEETDAREKAYSSKRFREEAMILFNLHHSGLPKVTDFFVSKDQETGKTAHFLVMTYIEGEDLEAIMQKRSNQPLPSNRVLDILGRVLGILDYIHGQDPPVIYRDMKPSNIMISEDGRVSLVDFGIAKQPVGRRKGTRIGTRGYAAPEQYQGLADERSDIYSLGVTMHYALTGKDPQAPDASPFKFENIRDVNPSASEALEQVVSDMMSIDVSKRPRSVKEVIFSLESLTGKKPSKPTAGSQSPAKPQPTVFPTQWPPEPVTPRQMVSPPAAASSSPTPIAPLKKTPPPVEPAPSAAQSGIKTTPSASTIPAPQSPFLPEVKTPPGSSPKKAPDSSKSAGTSTAQKPRRKMDYTEMIKRQGRIARQKARWKQARVLKGQSGPINDLAFSSDGRYLFSASDDWTVRVWDVHTGLPVASLEEHEGQVRCLALSPDGKTLATGCSDMIIRLFDYKKQEMVRELSEYKMPYTSMVYSRDGRTLLTGTSGVDLILWDIRSGNLVLKMDRHYSTVYQAIYNLEGQVVSCSGDRTVRLWNPMTGRQLHIFERHTNAVRCIALSPEGLYIASGSDDLKIFTWSIPDLVFLNEMEGHNDSITGMDWSPDGKHLASCSEDKSVRIWDMEKNEMLEILRGHQGGVKTVKFSPDGKTIASGARDNRVILWQSR